MGVAATTGNGNNQLVRRRQMSFLFIFIILMFVLPSIILGSFMWYTMLPLIFLAVIFLVLRFRVMAALQTRGLPEDAQDISGTAEGDLLLADLQGEWKIIPFNAAVHANPNTGVAYQSRIRRIAYDTAYVNGTMLSLSGGNAISPQTQQLFLSKTPSGTIYLDRLGSYITNWDKTKHEIHINNALNMTLIWKRKADWIMQNAGSVPNPAPVQVLILPHWYEQLKAPDGRTYYRNNFKKTTSWTPPTQAEIDADKAAGAGAPSTTAGAPPPNYDAPPPAFDAAPPPYNPEGEGQ